jgi:hypothetical protein
MLIGGNQKCKEFFEKFDLDKDNIHHKYKTIAAKFYRDNLDNILKGNDLNQEPSYDQGREFFQFQSKMDSGGLMAFGSDDLVQDERKVDSGFKENWEKGKKTVSMWGMNIGKGFNSLVEKTKKRFEKKKEDENPEQQEIQEQQENQGEAQPEEKSATREKFDKGFDNFKKGMGTLGSKISLGWSMFSAKTKELAQDSKRFIQETKEKYSSNPTNVENKNKYESGENPQGPNRGMMDDDVYERKKPEYHNDLVHPPAPARTPPKDFQKKENQEEEVNYI